MSILVVEDDSSIRRTLEQGLAERGYAASATATGLTGLERVLDGRFDAVLLDVALPDVDAVTMLRMIRAASEVPVIVIAAADDGALMVRTLDAGADDYVVKPVALDQLAARIRAAVRRARRAAGDTPLRVGELSVDERSRTATLAGVPLALARRESTSICRGCVASSVSPPRLLATSRPCAGWVFGWSIRRSPGRPERSLVLRPLGGPGCPSIRCARAAAAPTFKTSRTRRVHTPEGHTMDLTTTARRSGAVLASLAAGALLTLASPSAGHASASRDSDGDGMPNRWEVAHHLNPHKANAKADPDRDGLTNLGEYRHGTAPHSDDSDNDGVDDGAEVHDGCTATDPTDSDTDGDGVEDGQEDTDGDGVDDADDPTEDNCQGDEDVPGGGHGGHHGGNGAVAFYAVR